MQMLVCLLSEVVCIPTARRALTPSLSPTSSLLYFPLSPALLGCHCVENVASPPSPSTRAATARCRRLLAFPPPPFL